MASPIQIVDGSKTASFDGLVLEVTGISGSADSKRVTIQNIDHVAVAAAGDEWMFGVKTHIGGFSVMISLEKKAEWEHLVQTVMDARATFQG